MDKEKRKYERSKVWPETEAILEFSNTEAAQAGGLVTIKSRVDNLSVSGMYVFTDEQIPLDNAVSITIDFEPGREPPNIIQAVGIVVRQDDGGIAIQFTDIDSQLLGQCILSKLKED